jgi:CheY-like chemotaxis protein
MWLDSKVGVGSTFGFSIPSREREGAERRDESAEAPLVGLVVVIEDDRPSLELLMVYLSAMASDITVARDGPSGLETVRRVHPEVVLLDIRLPGIDGWAVLEALKSDPDTRDIPVVVASIVDERARGVALGAAAYLVKPISREDLRAALTTVAFLPGSPAPAPHETDTAPITGTGA